MTAPTVQDVMRQLATERNLRGLKEAELRDLRRDYARVASTSRSRTHYVILVPKPKWNAIRDSALLLFSRLGRWVRALLVNVKEAAWPSPAED